MNGEMNANIESFLELYQSERMKKQYSLYLTKFFEWLKKTPNEIVEEWKATEDRNEFLKTYGQIVTRYYNYHLSRNVKVNTALGYVTPVRAWFRVNCDTLREVKICSRLGEEPIEFRRNISLSRPQYTFVGYLHSMRFII